MNDLEKSSFAKSSKTQFDHVYSCKECRAYYKELLPLDYQLPGHIAPIAHWALRELQRLRSPCQLKVVDVAAGYGALSALLRYKVCMRTLLERYIVPSICELEPDELIAADIEWYSRQQRADISPWILGTDTSHSALQYGKLVGLYDAVCSDDLECSDPQPEHAALLANVSLIMEAGGIGYVGPRTFERLLAFSGQRQPWIIIAPTRVSDEAPIIEALECGGLTVERCSVSPVRHRRFTGDVEKRNAIAAIRRKGLNPSGLEDTGYYYANIFVARPPNEMEGGFPATTRPQL